MTNDEARRMFAAHAMNALIIAYPQRLTGALESALGLAGAAWDIADAMMSEEVTDEDSPLRGGLAATDEERDELYPLPPTAHNVELLRKRKSNGGS